MKTGMDFPVSMVDPVSSQSTAMQGILAGEKGCGGVKWLVSVGTGLAGLELHRRSSACERGSHPFEMIQNDVCIVTGQKNHHHPRRASFVAIHFHSKITSQFEPVCRGQMRIATSSSR